MNITSAELSRLQKGEQIISKVSKYRNHKATDSLGNKWDSEKEKRHFHYHLIPMQSIGAIREVTRQVKYKIIVNGVKICTYIADFTYIDSQGNKVVVDVKSEFTRKLPVYRLKKKLMLAVHQVTIKEV